MFVDNEDLNALIGATARRLRELKKLSLREVEELSGINSAQIGRLEVGRANWMPHHMAAIAAALGVGPRDLFPDNPTPPLPEAVQRLLNAAMAKDWPRAMLVLGELATQPDDKEADR